MNKDDYQDDTMAQARHPDLPALIAYVHGESTDRARAEIDAHLETCALCVEAVEALELSPDTAADMQAHAELLRESFAEATPQEQAPRRTGVPAWWRVAAMAFFAVNLGLLALMVVPGGNGFSAYTVSQGKGAPDGQLAEALVPYKAGDFEGAVAALKAMPDSTDLIESKLFYLGNAYLETGNDEAAVKVLEKLVGNPDWFLFRDEARRCLRVAYQRMLE